MKKLLSALVLVALAPAALHADGARASQSLPVHLAADASAPAVSERNLLASDRFWPYQVALTRDWQGEGRRLASGSLGVLIRVESSGAARVDFGRDGLHELPVGATDLVDRANRVRTGELAKAAPNFAFAIGPRLIDPASLRPLGLAASVHRRGFLAVFADPSAREFAALARALAPLRDRRGVLTVVFPQGAHADAAVRERLAALGWEAPFVFDHLAESYTRTLLREGAAMPALLLQTSEGRVVFSSPWSEPAAEALGAALERAFPLLPGASAAR